MPALEDAILLAIQAHRGQIDKAGQPYILHPLRVMLAVDTGLERIIAILHDVIEDTPCTPHDLRQMGYEEEIIQALDCLTRNRGSESYEEFIERAGANPLARRVKIADLEDNLDVRRLSALTDRDLERLERYRKAWVRLRGVGD